MGLNVSNDSRKETDVSTLRGSPVTERCLHDMDPRYCASCREHAPSPDLLAGLEEADQGVANGDAEGDAGPDAPGRTARV
jgi:hypothetical protein